jgi:hypothetical protein
VTLFADDFDKCESDPAYSYDKTEEAVERQRWENVLPEGEDEGGKSDQLREAVMAGIDEAKQRIVVSWLARQCISAIPMLRPDNAFDCLHYHRHWS